MTIPRSRRSLRPAAIPLVALALGIPTAAQGSVTLYENSSFGGSSAGVTLSTWGRNAPVPLAAYSFNDRATSLTWSLSTNVAVTFYENSDGSGAQWNLSRTAARTGLNPNIGATYNDTWSAFSWQLDDPSVGGTVTLYENSGFGGIAKRLPLSSYLEGGLHRLYGFDDKATGIAWSLQPNVVVTFYENADGTGREYTLTHEQSSGSISAVSSGYNDTFSSFRWQHVDPAQGWFRLYTDGNYDGYQLTRYVSEVGLGQISLSALGHNDQVDSFRWTLPPGKTVLLYDHDPAGGECFSMTLQGARDVRNLRLHDKISIVEVLDGDFCADLADRNKPYDRNTYLASHNAHCARPQGWSITWNQDLSLEAQLDYGARTLQLDTLLHNGTIYLVHNDWNLTLLQRGGLVPETLDQGLQVIEQWLRDNPREVVTLIFQNADGRELGDYMLDQSRVRNMIHVQQRGSWPTLNELIASGKRLVVFEMNSTTRSNRLAWQFDHCVENDYDAWFSTTERAESMPIDELGRGLFYMNNINPQPPSSWLPGTTPNTLSNLASLTAAFPQLPNYVGVDRITEGGQGAADMVRLANRTLWPMRELPGAIRGDYARFGRLDCGLRALGARNRPIIGQTLDFDLVTDVTGGVAGDLLIGTSDLSFGAATLPLNLQPLLGVRCKLRVSPEIQMPYLSFSVPGRIRLPIPNAPGLVGADVYVQTVDFIGGTLQMSDAGRAHIGLR